MHGTLSALYARFLREPVSDPRLFSFRRALVNDSYWTDLCLLFPPHIIAISCLYLAVVSKEGDDKKKEAMIQWFAELNINLDEVPSPPFPPLLSLVSWSHFIQNPTKVIEITQEMLSAFKIWEQYKTEMRNDSRVIDEILKKARPPRM